MKHEILVLSNELTKEELPPSKICDAELSSVGPSSLALTKELTLEMSALQIFPCDNSTFINSFDQCKFSYT